MKWIEYVRDSWWTNLQYLLRRYNPAEPEKETTKNIIKTNLREEI